MKASEMSGRDVFIRLLLSVLFAFPTAMLARSFAVSSELLTMTEILVITIMNAMIFMVAVLHDKKIIFTKDEEPVSKALNVGSYIVVILGLSEMIYLFINF